MATNALDVDIEVVQSTKEMLIFLIGKDPSLSWVKDGKVNPENFNEATKVIAKALREATK